MALWIRNRPPERCHRAEVEVAEFLAELSNDWVIRWGFSYCDNSGIQREGDFLVLGPRGGLLVIEVKSGSIIHNPYTGVWNTADGDNPQLQLDAEWKAVVNTINDFRDSRPSLHVGRALGTPDLSLQPGVQEHYGIAREFILDRGDLRRFEESWESRMTGWKARLDPRSRDIFFDSYGREATPREISHFLATTQFKPVRVQLHGTVRYTRPILAYLKQLDSPATVDLVAGLHQVIPLPPGPDVVEECVQPGDEFATVDRLLRHWFGHGWCRPEQVVILSRRGPLKRSALVGQTHIGGVPLHDGLVNPRGIVGFGSVNRAKGLDRLAVIILGFQPWDQLDSADQVSLFMGASRARLLLAIVSTKFPSPPGAARSAICGRE
jgi:hypothetical protein